MKFRGDGEMKRKTSLLALVLVLVLITSSTVYAAPKNKAEDVHSFDPSKTVAELFPGLDIGTPESDEWENGNYPMVYYSEIPDVLAELEKSDRISVEVIGQSAGGRDLYRVIATEPSAHGKYGKYKMLRNMMIKDPEKAQEMIEKDSDYKVPIYINNSIHGGETTGVDAGLKFLAELAYSDSEEVQKILENTIIVMNIVANPDGRVHGWRQNDNGFDCNRDMVTQSQPENRAMVDIMAEWKPMVTIDNHGFVNPILIEPCSMPHNPNYEEDIYQHWALSVAEAAEARLNEEMPEDFPFAEIPYRDYNDQGNWDDYPAIFVGQFAQYYGLTTHCVEVGPRDQRGVDGHYWVNKGAALFAAEHKEEMFNDQIEIFKRGTNFGGPAGGEFPYAYIIPMDENQKNIAEAAKTIDLLIDADIDVMVATKEFEYGDKTYGKGTYVVPMNQPLAGLANTLLWESEDLTYNPGLPMYDIAANSLPELWGFDRVIAEEEFSANLRKASKAEYPEGEVIDQAAPAFMLKNDTNDAIIAVNELLAQGVEVAQLTKDIEGFKAGDFVISSDAQLLDRLAKDYLLTFIGTDSVPQDAKILKSLKIGVYTRRYDAPGTPADPGTPNWPLDEDNYDYGSSGSAGNRDAGPTEFVLKQLGFDVEIIRKEDIARGLEDYDVMVTSDPASLNTAAKEEIARYVENGGGIVAFSYGGTYFAQTLGLIDSTSGEADGNGILNIRYAQDNPFTGSYPENDFVFGYYPQYFNPSPDAEVLGTYADEAFFAGYMPGNEALNGMPAIIREGNTIVFGNDLIFRAHIKNGFRALANSIYQLGR